MTPTTVVERVCALEKLFEELRASRPVAAQVLTITDDPDADAEAVARVVDLDPLLTTQILRMANSAAFGMRFRVASTQLAVSVLGFSAVRSVAVLFASGLRNHRRAIPPGFWQHAATAAAAASILAPRFGIAKGEAFSLGLIHDLGTAMLQSVDPGLYDEVHPTDTGVACAEELARFGMSHAEVAARLLEGWSFPTHLVETIASHHDTAIGMSAHGRLLAAADAVAHLVLEPAGIVQMDPLRMEWLDTSPEALERLAELTREHAADVLAALPT
jgi:putative nucleotidyltransferase with HDIG domain